MAVVSSCQRWAGADNEGVKRAGLLAVTAMAIVTASCSSASRSIATSSASPAASSQAHLAVPASCPVTRPSPRASPPPQLHAIDNFTFYLHGWYGNSALWVGVPVRGVLPAVHPYGTAWASEWGTKFVWWPIMHGTLTITARRLDGPSAGFHSQLSNPGHIGRARFIPSGLIWPAPGCWQVTGSVSGHSLTFVAWITTSVS